MKHLYVHVPFCGRRCSYCDFAIAVRRSVPVDEFVSGIRAELEIRFRDSDGWEIDTLYLGGGTPSRLGASGIERLIDVIHSFANLSDEAEVTLEANPDDVTLDAARAWRQAGINRLSIGAQSFDESALSWMHRTHDAAAIDRAVERARTAGIDNHSLDLIFALPETVTRDWEHDLERALGLAPSHVSLYGLTVEPRAPLGRRKARGELIEAPDERYEREFLAAHDMLTSAGFDHYEVSNFARSGKRSRHNSAYWTGVPYGGIGSSAHEYDGAVRRWNVNAYTEWLRRLGARSDPIGGSERLSPENRVAEDVYLALRTDHGLLLSAGEVHRVRPWIEAGWATLIADTTLMLTSLGWLRLDSLAADLTLFRSRSYF